MVVQHNISAMNANRLFGINNSGLSKSLEKLSSGYAINRAGDNAAGLAVSEKMRAQISGLTQASKNAEDGISMVQTFEGALTETDSILQRMRTLAVQSANGTYQDDVDREAIQLEYDQLNDELNQIADTDFNGVVVLNGGQMADGLKAVDGSFDYKNKKGQIDAANAQQLAAAQEKAQVAVDAAQKEVDSALLGVTNAQEALNASPKDLSNNGSAAEWNTVDNSKYTNALAGKLFDAAISSPNTGSVDRAAAGTAEGWEGLDDTKYTSTAAQDLFDNLETADGETLSDAEAVSTKVTFTYDEENKTWNATSATAKDADGNEISVANADQIFGTENVDGSDAITGKGGFKIKNGADEIANAIFDTTNLNNGDEVVVEFTSPLAATKKAPANAGIDGLTSEPTTAGGIAAGVDATFELNSTNVTDENMSAEMKKALDALNDLSFSYEVTDGATTGVYTHTIKATIDGTTVTDTELNSATYAELGTTGLKYKVSDGANGKVVSFADANEKEIGTLTLEPDAAAKNDNANATKTTVKGNIAIAESAFDAGSTGVQATVKSSETLEANKPLSEATAMDVTFTAKVDEAGNVTWEATSGTATNKDGSTNSVDNIEDLFKTTTDGNGGFLVKNSDGEELANAIFNSKNVKTGDTVTLTFTNTTKSNDAPDNVGFAESSVDTSKLSISNGGTVANPTVALDTGFTDSDMNAQSKAALDALQGAAINAKYNGATDPASFTIGTGKDEVKLVDGQQFEYNGVKMYADIDTGAGTVSIHAAKEDPVDGTLSQGEKILTVTFADPTENATGKVSAELRFDSYSFDPSLTDSTVTVGADKELSGKNGDTAALESALKSAQDAHAAALEKLAAAKKAYPTSIEDVDTGAVSKSDSNDASTATLTYQDNITLQTGARTKDSVNFTFSYDSNGLGDLNADLDCSARGLGTDKLSLADQESANAAIDKIDNAINKVSMVRASFGAMQNRLEHKIANLDVNTENLTAAESRIRDTDMASEMTNFTKNQILSQASQAMLAQANQLPQGVLQLLG